MKRRRPQRKGRLNGLRKRGRMTTRLSLKGLKRLKGSADFSIALMSSRRHHRHCQMLSRLIPRLRLPYRFHRVREKEFQEIIIKELFVYLFYYLFICDK